MYKVYRKPPLCMHDIHWFFLIYWPSKVDRHVLCLLLVLVMKFTYTQLGCHGNRLHNIEHFLFSLGVLWLTENECMAMRWL